MKKLTFLSFGGGQDSWTMLRLAVHSKNFREKYIPGDFIILMSDTGDEHDHTIRDVEKAKRLCDSNEIEFFFIKNKDGFHKKSWPDLITPQKRTGSDSYKATMVQLGTKTCTHNLKIVPLYKFLDEWINKKYGYGFKVWKGRGCRKKALKKFGEENGPIHVLIGFAYGEEKRADSSKKFENKIKESKSDKWEKYLFRRFPLIDLKMGRTECQNYLSQFGEVPYPSNCKRCPYMSAEELLWLSIHHPCDFLEWVEIERRKIERHDGDPKNYGVMVNQKLLPERLAEVKKKYSHLTKEALLKFLDQYKMNHGCGSGGY